MRALVVAATLSLLAAPVRAEVAGPAAPAAGGTTAQEPARSLVDGNRTLRRLPANLGRSLVGVVSPESLSPFILGGMAAGTASFFDEDARETMTGQLEWSEDFETAGGPVYSTLFVVGMFTAGRFAAPGGRFRAMTYDMLDAAIVNAAYSSVIKELVGRERPNGQDDKSFPSGHTSNAFALAAVAERHYGWKLGVPAYALAGLMGLSRMNEDKHWLSDVVAGATLGFVVGRTVVRVNGRGAERVSRATWSLSPIVARHTHGVQLSGSF